MSTDGNLSLTERIFRLKEERNAVILAHNYQPGDIQDIADFVGDSLELALKAAETHADNIVFCGVHFMAEMAAIVCPQMTVLLPDKNAGCPMADMITAGQLREEKRKHPGATVVCYVNTSAEVKAESDICCTSANGVRVVQSVENEEILFVPDQYLGSYVASVTGRKLILWPGYCPVHARIEPQDILGLKEKHPSARVVVHPECRPEVIRLADEVMSTGGMCRYAAREDVRELIVGTEEGIIHRLQKENPGKLFLPVAGGPVCTDMKLITLEKVLKSLEEMSPRVELPGEIRLRAKTAVDRMLQLG